MAVRAICGEVVTSVGQRTPGGSGSESGASSAIVMSETTARDCNTRLGSGAPGLAAGAHALEGPTVVVGGQRTIGWESVTRVGQSAKTSVGLVGQTVSAGIVSSATAGHEDA